MDGRVTVGHPVDVATGTVFTMAADFEVPGALRLEWLRHYTSALTVNSWLGLGWTVPFFMELHIGEHGYTLVDEQGSRIVFDHDGPVAVGEHIVNVGANMSLSHEGDFLTILHWHHGSEVIERFGFAVSGAEILPLSFIADLGGRRVDVSRDGLGRPWRITQSLEARTVELEYDRRDLVQNVYFLQDGARVRNLVRYEYDDRRHLISATDAMGYRTTYAYDAAGRIIAETGPEGSTFRFIYDGLGRCVYTSGNDRFLERRLEFFGSPRRTVVTDSLGNRTTYLLNSASQLLQEISPRGAVTTYAYDAYGRLVSIGRAGGGVERFEYDASGNRTALIDQIGNRITLAFNAKHQVEAVIEPTGAKTTLEYDERGSLLSLTNALGVRWSWKYNEQALAREVALPSGQIVRYRYGPRMAWVEAADNLSLLYRAEFDAFGNTVALFDAQGLVERLEYDALDRCIKVQPAEGLAVAYGRNALGDMVEMRHADGRRQFWRFDRFGRLVEQIDALGQVMRLEYDTEDRLTAVTDRAGARLSHEYDSEGQVLAERLFDGRVIRYEYDMEGRCVHIIKSDGRTIDQSFDPAGNLIRRAASDGSFVALAYDANGLILSAETAESRIVFERDALGRLTAETQNERRIEYDYDEGNNPRLRRLLGAPEWTLHFQFDVRGRPSSFADPEGTCQTFRWDGLDRLSERSLPAGGRESFQYDSGRRLARHEVVLPGPRLSRRYGYDLHDNVATLEQLGEEPKQLRYDALNRLIAVDSFGRQRERYVYDEISNVVETHRGARVTAGGGRTLSADDRRMYYDDDGCIGHIETPEWEVDLKYDVDGNLTEVMRSDGQQVRYVYDAFGRRLSKTVDGTRYEYLWDGYDLAAEVHEGRIKAQHLCIARSPVASWIGGRRFALVTNRSSVVEEVIDERGELAWRGCFDAYGNLESERGSPRSPFRFRGQYHDDETGFHYNIMRPYDPVLAGYLSPDPIGLEGGANFYIYPRNPLLYDDPFGLRCSNKHKGQMGERRMDRYYANKGYRPIHRSAKERGHSNGIDGVYYNPNRKPRYIIVESKYGGSQRSRTADGNLQLSDPWINASPNSHTSTDRLTDAVGSAAADRIRDAARNDRPGLVEKQVFYAPNGQPGYRKSIGSYNPAGTDPDV